MFDRTALVRYYDYLQLSEAKILELLKIALSSKKYEEMQKLLFAVGEGFNNLQSNLQNEWRKSTFKKLYSNFAQFLQYNPNVKYVNDKIKPYNMG
jgi:hypothetical protein